MKLKKSNEKSLLIEHAQKRAAPTPPGTIAYVDGRFVRAMFNKVKTGIKRA